MLCGENIYASQIEKKMKSGTNVSERKATQANAFPWRMIRLALGK